jgi:hypothetical protein
MILRGMMFGPATGLLLASFVAAPANAAPTLASQDVRSLSSQAPFIDRVRYVCWWKHGYKRKCDWVGPEYYSRGYRYYEGPAYYQRPYRHYYDDDDGDYRYRRWDGYRRERDWR